MMRKLISHRYLLLLIIILWLAGFTSCYSQEKFDYYAEKDNYISVSGTVSHIAYDENGEFLSLGISDISYQLDDNAFKIVGDNLRIALANDFEDKVLIGTKIDFITAPKYFGDGYIMPIVAISVNGESILDYEEGYLNLLKWLKNN